MLPRRRIDPPIPIRLIAQPLRAPRDDRLRAHADGPRRHAVMWRARICRPHALRTPAAAELEVTTGRSSLIAEAQVEVNEIEAATKAALADDRVAIGACFCNHGSEGHRSRVFNISSNEHAANQLLMHMLAHG